jgi:16S rRNA (guanine527-N7)-methyltransferase
MQDEKKNRFINCCSANGLSLEGSQIDLLEQYIRNLTDWNGKINLISRKDLENMWDYHILHCVSLLMKVKIARGSNLVDIGTGGGLPAIPLKILRPDLSFLCVDSTRKKAHAVQNMIEELKLHNISAVWGRAEEIGPQKEFNGRYDFALARAVAPLKDLAFWARGFLKESVDHRYSEDGSNKGLVDPEPPSLITYKGGELAKEIDDAKRQHAGLTVRQIEIIITGFEQFMNADKKILIVHYKQIDKESR